MAGTLHGGRKAAQRNIERYGKDYYKRIGALGGAISRTGGFASNKVGADGLTGKQRASIVGAKGGRISRRNSKKDA